VVYRTPNHEVARWTAGATAPAALPEQLNPFGANVFNTVAQRDRLPSDAFARLQATIDDARPLDGDLAETVAAAMKDWALEHGATHYSHWFQPLTGSTAEKHDSFFNPVGDGTALAEFSGSELVQGEPDASSFPNGGIRQTFEARGYTAWDPTSPAFILESSNGSVLCIPTAFASHTGEALDHKIPLLRSMDALSAAAVGALRVLGDDVTERVISTVGVEQEYFLIDEKYVYARPDLLTTGRTLFGAKPPKGQELDDHYFGSIPERVLSCMLDAERELVKLGVPVKTRHNEVAPGQYEIAPIFENTNVGVDHQQLTMQVLRNTARRHGLVCLLHEKPFAGVNGSGKHNNWSLGTDTGENLLSPGATPHENERFLFFCAAVIKAVDVHQGLLRASAASAGQDHRLGANEAPPAIMSMFLGTELETIFAALARGEQTEQAVKERLLLGTPVLPRLPKHGGDRNRTSPLAFTGNKFEFRALGSAQSPALCNTILNTIVADALDTLAREVSDRVSAGDTVQTAVRSVVADTYREHGRIVFDGDGYSGEWEAEAARRGLLNLRTTPDALPFLVADTTVRVFAQRSVMSARELEARYEVLVEQYATKLNIEAGTAAQIARTMLLPAGLRYREEIAMSGSPLCDALLVEVDAPLGELHASLVALEAANADGPPSGGVPSATYVRDRVLPAMSRVRDAADRLERLVADDRWPLPTYAEMLFIR
jgi:glutamine synthetase